MSGSVERIDHGWKALRERLAQAKNSFTKVGVQKNTRRDDSVVSMATVAMANEFGVPGDGQNYHTPGWKIPPRPAMRLAFEQNKQAIKTLTAHEKDRILRGTSTVKESLSRIGEFFKGEIVAKIHSNIRPENADETKARKGSTSTLVDSGQYAQSIHHVEIIKGNRS